MPALFLAHGNPMNAIADSEFTRALGRIASELPRPDAILVVSAHWLTRGTHVLATDPPRTIHDFGGFPPELYAVQYPAPGAPAHAAMVKELLPEVQLDYEWGLDHASWAVLRHMWPAADVPAFELSLDVAAPPQAHWELGRRLAPLRDRGVLVIGSGNIVHSFAGVVCGGRATPHAWAVEFDAFVAEALIRQTRPLVHYETTGLRPAGSHQRALRAAATPAAMYTQNDRMTFPHVGIEMASMSTRCGVRLRGRALTECARFG
jgi:4,5-DOPA dioxygenase extradiol